MVQYTLLNSARSEIRLLALLPGKSHEPIRCNLHVASLDDAPNFEALSYVWGDPMVKRPIAVDGEEFLATTNLEAALRAFRSSSRRRILWVDAICINQDDIPEKNVQVPQMGRLYSTASDVLVWLGSSNLNIERAVSWVHTYVAKSYTSTGSAYWLKLDARAAFSTKAKREKEWAVLQALEGYFDILALPYWNRMWTFQEFRLPGSEPLCFCGEITFRATEVLGRAQDALHEVGYEILSRFSKSLDTGHKWSELEAKEATEIQSFARRLQHKSDTARKNMIVSPQVVREEWRNKESPLLYLLTTTAERNCFNKRDNVYALYAMVPEVQSLYPPDYTRQYEDIMLETTTYMINCERGSLMWGIFSLRDDRLSNTSYPSWVPDFAVADMSGPNNHRGLTHEWRAPEALRRWEDAPAPRVTTDLATVHLFTRSLGPCKVAFVFSSEGKDHILNQIQGLLQAKPSDLPVSTRMEIRKPETLTARIARACVAHHVRQSKFSDEEILETFELVFKHSESAMLPDEVRKGSCWPMIEDAVRGLAGKSFLVTEGGCFGISVGAVMDGDVVTIPPQVRFPVVFTRHPEEKAGGGLGNYRMVGTAYIDGLMGDNNYDAELVADILEQGLTEFLIC